MVGLNNIITRKNNQENKSDSHNFFAFGKVHIQALMGYQNHIKKRLNFHKQKVLQHEIERFKI
jgi:hypothetical protein